MAASFDSVILKDKDIKGVGWGVIKLVLDGLKKTDPAGTDYKDRCIEVWCEMSGKKYSFSHELPEGAMIEETSLSITERNKGKLKVSFKKKSVFKLE